MMKTKITPEGWMVIEGDLISGWVEENKMLAHDEFLIPLACNEIPEQGTVIDCGANIGSHSVAYAAKLGKKGNLICIEAGKTAFECLTHNAQFFLSQVFLINACVCDQFGGKAYHQVNEENVGMSIVSAVEGIEVNTLTIDGLVAAGDINRLDFIKIDVEGWEMKVLKGAERSIMMYRPKMLIEMNSHALSQQGSTYKEVYDYLLKLKYSWTICQPQSKGGDEVYDILCIPNKIEKLELVK